MGHLQLPLWLAKLCNLWLCHFVQCVLDRRHRGLFAHEVQGVQRASSFYEGKVFSCTRRGAAQF